MFEHLRVLFSSDFLPHGVCMRWQSDVIFLHVVSDSAVALAYFCIPGMLYYFIRRRPDVSFHWIFIAFSLFIMCCGLTHAMDVVTLWYPLYRLAGVVKACTALASVGTAISLAWFMPRFLKLPSVKQLAEVNAHLTAEIQHRQEAETKFTEANRALETALNSSQVALWIWNIRNDSAVWSGPVEQIFGSTLPRLNGLKAISELVHPDDRERLSTQLTAAIEKACEFELEYRIVRAGGEVRWIAGRGDATRLDEGRALEMSGINYDITEKKRIENALARSEKEFRQLANAMPQIVFAADADGKVYFLNDHWHEITGLPMERVPTLVERKQVLHPDDRDGWEACWTEALTTGSYEMEHRLWDREKQEYRWYLSRGRAVRDANGVIQRWFGTATDIHDRKAANELLELEVRKRTADLSTSLGRLKQSEETLLQSLAEKNALLKEVHHRVRNNLQIVYSLLGMQVSLIQDGSAIAQLRDAERRVMSMAFIHDQLYSHEEMSSIDFDEYVRKWIASLPACFDRNDMVTCRLNLSPVRLTIEQAVPCGLILNELVTNALEHAYPPGHCGEITIDLSGEPGWICLCVRDEGVGLPVDFDLSATKTLGISVIQVLAAQLDGHFEVRGEMGTAFSLRFPQAVQQFLVSTT